MRRSILVWLLMLAALALAGCVKVKQRLYLMADGSGRLTVSVAIREDPEADKKDRADSRLPDEALEVLLRDWEGFAAFAPPIRRTTDGWTQLTVTGYFEDIGKVRVHHSRPGPDGRPERSVRLSYKLGKRQDGTHLEIRNESFAPLADAAPAPGKETPVEERTLIEAALQALFQGFEYVETYDVPGQLSRTDGLSSREGRRGKLEVETDDLVRGPRIRELAETSTRHLVWGRDERSKQERTRFGRELEDARRSWERRLAERASATGDDSEGTSKDKREDGDEPR